MAPAKVRIACAPERRGDACTALARCRSAPW